jgi:hypothetical protein
MTSPREFGAQVSDENHRCRPKRPREEGTMAIASSSWLTTDLLYGLPLLTKCEHSIPLPIGCKVPVKVMLRVCSRPLSS